MFVYILLPGGSFCIFGVVCALPHSHSGLALARSSYPGRRRGVTLYFSAYSLPLFYVYIVANVSPVNTLWMIMVLHRERSESSINKGIHTTYYTSIVERSCNLSSTYKVPHDSAHTVHLVMSLGNPSSASSNHSALNQTSY